MSVLLELPLSGDVQVYGGFAGSDPYYSVQAIISYTTVGGHLPPFDLASQNTTFAEYIVSIHVNMASITTYSCNGFEGGYHCSQADQIQPYTSIMSLDGIDGTLHIGAHVSYVIGSQFADPPPDSMITTLHLFATLPDGFSLAPPVPEPATWLLMILGFAIIGLTVIRRKGYSAYPEAG